MKKKYLSFFLTLIVGNIFGIIIGISIMTTLVSFRIDKYHEKIKYLENVIEDKDTKLKKLEKSINNRRFILQSIEIILIYDGDDLDKISLEKNIKEKYKNLLGKEVQKIDIDMVKEIVDQRIIKLDDKIYKLEVTKLVLSNVLKIWIKVRLID
ncbi:hypothetical protein BET03_09585 [Thermohalobacter berrensis]|uniref:Sporulation membrane protein YtrI C-terminal domain-containing protein n=1 Tax=Thermohalobacter berrensis TaxID=99594 RepID=A0A419T6L9_9FIRM|nr:hypothetical protein BET03_09585 [Thermohalobacter berrensis]